MHLLFEVLIDKRFICLGEECEVHAFSLFTHYGGQVAIEAVGIVGSDGRHEVTHGEEAFVECLISRNLILCHFACPEAFTVQAHIPVREVVRHEGLNQATRTRGFVFLISGRNTLDERLEFGENPTVDFGTLRIGHLCGAIVETIDIGIHCKEAVTLEELCKEAACHFLHTVLVELEVVPGCRVRNHVPTHGVRTKFLDAFEGVDTVAEAL